MAIALRVGEEVFIPSSLLDEVPEQPSAFLRRPVMEVAARTVRVEVGGASHWVASSKCQRNIGLLIFCIGDLETESTLLDPLAKSVTQFCRLLASDDYVRFYKIRSVAELQSIWIREHGAYSHVLIIGHGNGTGLNFAVDGWRSARELAEVLDVAGVDPKIFLSLTCKAGQAAFGRPFSEMRVCAEFIGAFHSVHGAIASQFVQSFLVYHLLEGETIKVAFRHSRHRVPGSTSFRLWRNGILNTDA
jgi:hypothetical protein